MRRLLVLALLAGLMISGEQAARACSCATGDPRSSLAEADGAFVGRLVHKGSPTPEPGGVYSSAQPVTYRFSVERSVKGKLGKTVDVRAAADGASCGLEVGVGERTGLLLFRDGDEWVSGLCSQMDPDVLLAAAEPLPAPDGSGPVRFLVGGRLGGMRMVALDARGRVLAYGAGDGHATALSLCPHAERVMEISYGSDGRGTFSPVLSVRDVNTLKVVSRRVLHDLAFTSPESLDIQALRCLDPKGTEAYLFVTEYGEPRSTGAILRLGTTGKPSTLYEGDADSALFAGDGIAYVTAGPYGNDVRRVDLASGRVATIAKKTGGLGRSLSLSPDGTRLAGVAGNWMLEPNEAKLVLIDMRSKPAAIRKTILGQRELGGPTVWYGNDRVVVTPGDGSIRILDEKLRQISSFKGWLGSSLAISGKTLFGCGWGWVGTASLPRGPVRRLHSFESPETFAFLVVPPPQPPSPSPAPSPGPETPGTSPPSEPSPTPRAMPAGLPGDGDPPGPAAAGAAGAALIVAVAWTLFRRRLSGRAQR